MSPEVAPCSDRDNSVILMRLAQIVFLDSRHTPFVLPASDAFDASFPSLDCSAALYMADRHLIDDRLSSQLSPGPLRSMTESLFTCAHRSPSEGEPKSTAKPRRRRETPSVDIHCHVHVHEADELLKSAQTEPVEPMLAYATDASRELNRLQMQQLRPRLTDLSARLQDMDRTGIDIQVLSPSPFQLAYWTEPDLGRSIARSVNDSIAEMVARVPDRFTGFGTAPLQAPELAVQELTRLVRDLGLRGIEVGGSVGNRELSDPVFHPFFAKAQELGAVVFLHPNGVSDGRRLSEHYFINLIGNPLETTVATSYLIFDGVLERYPELKLCLAHGGGYLPAYAARMDQGYAARSDCRRVLKRPPSQYLRRLYFDSVVFSTRQLEFLVREYGADHLLLGTDYPYDMGEGDPLGLLDRARSLTDDEYAMIAGVNAARLLGIRVPGDDFDSAAPGAPDRRNSP